MSNDDRRFQAVLKAFGVLEGWSRLITTVAVGVLALSATFIRDIIGQDVSGDYRGLLFAAWVVLVLCVAVGLRLLGAVSVRLNKKELGDLSIHDSHIMPWAIVQWVTFGLGIILFLIFVGVNL